MKTIVSRTCQVLGIGTGVAIAVGDPSGITPTLAIEDIPKTAVIGRAPTSAPSQALASSLLPTSVPPMTNRGSQFRFGIAQSRPHRQPPSSTQPSWDWVPSVFFLGFALGLIRRVAISLARTHSSRHNRASNHPQKFDHDGYSDASDFSGGRRGDW